jgi:hypothetical protein
LGDVAEWGHLLDLSLNLFDTAHRYSQYITRRFQRYTRLTL